MKNTFLTGPFLVVLGVASIGVSADNGGDHLKSKSTQTISMRMKTSMQKMAADSKSMKMTGDVDADFAQMMERHHQGAIEMAEMEIEYGHNAELKAMAKKMVSDQSEEQEALIKWTDKQKLKKDSAEKK